VLDEAGRPVANVSVTAIREEYAHGVRFLKEYRYMWEPAAETKTNKDGEYRVGRLRPGKYYLEAYYPPENKAGVSALARGYLPVYFPATTNLGFASPFFIAAGDERHADFHLVAKRTYRVRGKLVLPPRAAHSGPLWSLTDECGALVQHWGMKYDRGSNSFELGPLVSGSYVLWVSLGIYDADPAAWRSLDITDADIDGLVLSLHPGPIALNADVKLIAQGQDSQYVFKSVQADSDGHFRLAGVPPGVYNLVALNRLVRDVELGPLEFSRLDGLTKHIVVGDSARLTVQLQLSVFRP
jgi:hypothetical protein